MRIVDTFNPQTNTSTTFNAGFSNGAGRIVVYNESNYNLQLAWDAFSTYCPAWTAMLYCITSNNVNISWSIQSTLITTATPPISQVIIEAFDNNEPILGTFPAPLVRQTNIGNSVNANVSNANALINTGNPAGTNIVTVQASDAASATWIGDNSGNLTIKSDNAGTLTTLLQLIAGASPGVKLAAASVLVEALGNLQVDNNLTVKGSSSLDNSTITTDGSGDMTAAGNLTGHSHIHNHTDTGAGFYGQDGGGTPRVLLQLLSTDQDGHLYTTPAHKNLKISKNDGSGDIATFNDANGFTLNVGKINFGSGIGTLVSLTSGAGTGNGTSNTFITNPTAIVFDPCTQSGSSQTIGGTTTSTTTITTGAGLAWRYIAYLQ